MLVLQGFKAPFLFQEPIRSLGGEVLIKSNAKVVSVEFFPMALDLLKLGSFVQMRLYHLKAQKTLGFEVMSL